MMVTITMIRIDCGEAISKLVTFAFFHTSLRLFNLTFEYPREKNLERDISLSTYSFTLHTFHTYSDLRSSRYLILIEFVNNDNFSSTLYN